MTSKTKYNLIAIIISSLIIISLIFYIALRNTSKDISNKEPYSELINRQIINIDEAILIENSTMEFTEEYANELQDYQNIDTAKVKFTTVPKGSILEFKKVIQVNRAISGSKYAFLLGEVTIKDTNGKKAILYHWGTFKTICIEEPCNYWIHKKAPWQTEIDTKKHFD